MVLESRLTYLNLCTDVNLVRQFERVYENNLRQLSSFLAYLHKFSDITYANNS
jgi:hypothetical protein